MKQPVKELGKPSILSPNTLFEDITVVVADKDHKMALLIKKLLVAIGCRRVFSVSDGMDVIDLMREETVDIIITDWKLRTMGGIDLCIHLRQSLDSPNRTVPIIMLTAASERYHIETARDAGISEYIIKPFSARTLLERLYSIVESPRSFILSKTFVGPDRRRVSSLTLPTDEDEPREFFVRKPPVVVPKEQLSQIILDDTPRMILPDYELKKKIGMDVPAQFIISPDTIEVSENSIEEQHEHFMTCMLNDVRSLEENYELLLTKQEYVRELITHIKDLALAIQSRAGTFGYARGSEVAGMLYTFCYKHYDRNNKNHLIILEKLIQTISVIFNGDIKGSGGEVGNMLSSDLHKLIKKYLYPSY